MKFEIKNSPVLTGDAIITRLISRIDAGEPYHLSSVKPGIPCLILNRRICDINGVPFDNTDLQNKFDWISTRFHNCKFIGVGRIVYKEGYSTAEIARRVGITYDGHYKKYGVLVSIELEDIVSKAGVFITYEHRLKIIEGYTNAADNIKDMLTVQKQMPSSDKTKEGIRRFILENHKNGYLTLVKYSGITPYTEDGSIESYYINPSEVFSGDIIGMVSSKKKPISASEKRLNDIESLDFVTVMFNKRKIQIPMIGIPITTNLILLNAIKEKKIKKLLYSAIVTDGVLSNIKPI